MSSILPIGVEDLLSGRAVETARLELKESWNKENTGPQVLQTLCAFANDLQNLNGGYIAIGVAEAAGVAQSPVRGLAPEQIDAAQRWISGNCNRIQPAYMPVLSPEDMDGRKILVLWAPPSDRRPHQAPDARSGRPEYWVRIGSGTVKAKGALRDQLMQLTARVPFDDRRALSARLEDLREGRVREFLRDVHSGLVDEPDVRAVYRHARLSYRIDDHDVPRNVALLFFADDPEQWFRGACIEVAQFADDAAGNVLEEKTFRGPAHEQIRQCLRYLENFVSHHLEKVRDRAETRGWVSYPSLALRESIVNAAYHRSYEEDIPEPTKVYLYPNRVEIISYPGPVPGIDLEQLNQGRVSSPVPARNRRIGELLKELRLAESRNTGVSKIFKSMEDNGSPPPKFDFDPDRSYFRVTLPAHPEYIAIAALRDAAYLKATGDEERALARIREAWEAHPTSALLAASLIREYAERQDLAAARNVHDRSAAAQVPGYAGVAAAMAGAYLAAGRRPDALTILNRLRTVLSPVEAFNPELYQHQHRFVQQQTAVNIAVRIEQKNQVCIELGGLFDNLAEDVEVSDADPDEIKRLKTELDKVQRALERLEDNQDPDDKKETRGPLQRLKDFVERIADAETSLGKLVESIEGGGETARKAIDLYNKLAPLFDMPPIPHPIPKPGINGVRLD